MQKKVLIGMLLVSLLMVTAVPASQAFGLGDILKVGGMSILIDKFSTPLNNFINQLTFKHKLGSEYSTKVVPILSVGNHGYIGAAQVTGAQELVDKTEAVIQMEGSFNNDKFRVKALVPVDSTNPTNFTRVQGVGVSAIIDIKI
ncbi:hypothetical protein [Sporomusa sp.]|jgi:hypothetical protein|uniref:hypothetical protein n=1 Tax=Sporomusa sp. TaxID=2078658 RepID=UPI002B719D2F|nr:hypothetical protein [Sporomusa sp.]MDF2875552.1 hypothetical protein [Sporomusa sp.]HWR05289.1 hypothetical protein [Sporomusa sp.]